MAQPRQSHIFNGCSFKAIVPHRYPVEATDYTLETVMHIGSQPVRSTAIGSPDQRWLTSGMRAYLLWPLLKRKHFLFRLLRDAFDRHCKSCLHTREEIQSLQDPYEQMAIEITTHLKAARNALISWEIFAEWFVGPLLRKRTEVPYTQHIHKKIVYWRNTVFDAIYSLWKKPSLSLLLSLILLCGCSLSGTSQVSPTPTPKAQTVFASYVGTWNVHGALLFINADHTGLMQWNAGPCDAEMCGGNAHLLGRQR